MNKNPETELTKKDKIRLLETLADGTRTLRRVKDHATKLNIDPVIAWQWIKTNPTLEEVESLEELQIERAPGSFIKIKDADVYVVTTRNGMICLPVETHKMMLTMYSAYGDNADPEDIAQASGLSVSEFESYKRVMGWTRSSLPVEDEDDDMTPEDLAEEVVRLQKQRARRAVMDQVNTLNARDAAKYRQLEKSLHDGLADVVAQIPTAVFKAPKVKITGDNHLIIPLNDWQVGSFANPAMLRFGREFSRDVLGRMIDDYCAQLQNYVSEKKTAWGTPYVVLLGDILHGPLGTTVHNTYLAKHMHEFDWAQISLAIEMLYKVADTVIDLFGEMNVIALPGNHEGALVQFFGELLKQRYGSKVKKTVTPESRTHYELIAGSLYVFDHGASADSNVKGGKIPKAGLKRELMVKDLVYARADLVHQARENRGGVYFVMGDQHSLTDSIPTGVEMITLPALPSGDIYADENQWYSRPAQAVLLTGSEGLRHVERFYLDNKRVFPES